MNTSKLKAGWIDFVADHSFTDFLTLNFNRAASPQLGRSQLGRLLQRLDRYVLGPRYAKHTERRTFGIAFPEHLASNFHFHCPLKFNQPVPVSREMLAHVLGAFWKEVVPSGTIDLRAIYDLNGLAEYVTKELLRPDSRQNTILFSEFWPAGDHPDLHDIDWRAAQRLVHAERR